MTEMKQMTELIGMALSENNEERMKAEIQLEYFAQNSPDNFLLFNLQVIKDSTLHTNVRIFSVVLIKKYFVIGKNNLNLYLRITEVNLNVFQNEIFLLLTMIDNELLLNNLADFVAELGSSIINAEASKEWSLTELQRWMSLLSNVFALYSTKQENTMITALRIIEGLFYSAKDNLSHIKVDCFKLFEDCFTNQSMKVRVKGMNCLLSLVLGFKTKDSKNFKVYATLVLNLISENIKNNDINLVQDSVYKVFDICQNYPGYFKKIFPQLIRTMSELRDIKDDLNSNLKIQATESLVFIVERYDDLFEDENNKGQVVEIIFKNMLDIEDEVSDEWKSPPDGFNEDLEEDDDQSLVKIGMEFINRLITSVGHKTLIPFISNCIVVMLKNTNWQMKHAAILTISQIVEFIDDDEEIKNLVNIIQSQITSDNPRIRYACCHVLGQLAEDLAPNFQETFEEEFFGMILPLLDDQVPRVVSHCLCALTNFLEETTEEQVEPHFYLIYSKIMFWIENGIGFVKEACLSLLSALAESSELFLEKYNEVMNLLFNIISNVQNKEFKAIKGTAIECATLIGNHYGKEQFAPYTERMILQLIKIQSSEIELENYDPQKIFVLSAWQRLVTLLDQELLPYIQQILPSLLNLALTPLKKEQSERTSDSEEADLALQLIEVFMSSYPNELSLYIKDLYELMLLVNENILNSETKLAAVNCLPQLIKIAQLNQSCDFSNLSKSILGKVWDIFINEKDSSYRASYCLNIQEIITESGNLLNEEELFNFVQQCENELKKIEKRRQDILDGIDFDEEKPEVAHFNIKFENSMEDDCKLEIANIFGKLFKSYKSKSLSIFNYLYNHHIIPSLQNKQQNINISYALFLIDDAIEFIGSDIDHLILERFYEILLSYITHKSTDIRQPAMYGMGILVNHLPNFSLVIDNTIKTLSLGIEIKDADNAIPSNIEKCRENGVSSIGKIIKANWNSIERNNLVNYLDYWCKKLPIVYDLEEGLIMHEMFVEILLKDPILLLGGDYCNLNHIIGIFQKIYKKDKISSEAINLGIKEIMRNLLSEDDVKSKLPTLKLKKDQKEFINTFK